jgi:hypothetical protein
VEKLKLEIQKLKISHWMVENSVEKGENFLSFQHSKSALKG